MTMNPVLSLNLRKSFSGFELSVNADLAGGNCGRLWSVG